MKKDPCAVFTGAGVFRTFSRNSLVQIWGKNVDFRQNNKSLETIAVSRLSLWWTVQDSNL